MKDKILQRVKEYNAVALFVKLVDELTEHYKNKLLSVSSGRTTHTLHGDLMGNQRKRARLDAKCQVRKI